MLSLVWRHETLSQPQPPPPSFYFPQEGFSYGFSWPRERRPENGLQGPNVWPLGASQQTTQTLEQTYVTLVAVARAVVRGIALALNVPPETLLAHCCGGETISLVRLFHYFPAVAGRDNCIGSSPHTDWGFLTLIAQDAVGGLEYQNDGRWLAVPPTPEGVDELILNGGDALELMSRGRYRAPVHRVLCPPQERERYSLVFFYYPSYNARLDAPEWLGDAHVAPTKPVAPGSGDVCGINFEGGATADMSSLKAYNTLLQGVSRASDGGLPAFGDCILQKWQGVSRRG